MRLTDHGGDRFAGAGTRVFVLVMRPDGSREVAEVAEVRTQVDAIYSDGVGAGGPWWQDAPLHPVARRLTLRGRLLDWQADVPEPEPRGLPRPLPQIEP